jgi:hypothetical protein
MKLPPLFTAKIPCRWHKIYLRACHEPNQRYGPQGAIREKPSARTIGSSKYKNLKLKKQEKESERALADVLHISKLCVAYGRP